MNPNKLDIVANFNIESQEQLAEGQKPKSRRFSMTAYTGGPMMLDGWRYPVVIDLKGLNIGASSRPIFVSHNQDVDDLLGQTDQVNIVENNLIAAGNVLGDSPRVTASNHPCRQRFQLAGVNRRTRTTRLNL